MPNRRHCLRLAIAWPALGAWAQTPQAEALLRGGGVVLVMRHALAPGNFDPPEFALGDCSTQRNLNDEGRAQAQRIGAWFASRALRPTRVRTSPWCRCVDTARLAFGDAAQVWPALGSPRASADEANRAHGQALLQALVAASARRAGFEVWVTHMFVLSALVGAAADSGEGLVLRAGPTGSPEVLARLPAA